MRTGLQLLIYGQYSLKEVNIMNTENPLTETAVEDNDIILKITIDGEEQVLPKIDFSVPIDWDAIHKSMKAAIGPRRPFDLEDMA